MLAAGRWKQVFRCGVAQETLDWRSRLDLHFILWYDYSMKTTISLPGALFASADSLAKRLRVSRSALYAAAVAEYVAKHRDADVTARLNSVYADSPSGLDPDMRRAQARSVAEDW